MISIIIPCLNEELAIEKTIQEIQEASFEKTQIIVIDNGSSDETAKRAKTYGVEVYFEPQKGKGFAFRKGLEYVSKDSDVVVLIDGDNTYSVSRLKESVDAIRNQGFDMVIGVRQIPNVRDSAYRTGHIFGNRILSTVFRLLFNLDIRDSLSGYRVMSRSFAISFTGGAGNFELESKLNAHAYHLSSSVINLPVEYRSRPEGSFSKLNTFSDGLKILLSNFRLWRTEKPLIAFYLMSMPFYAAGFALGARAFSTYLSSGIVPNFPSLIVSVGLVVAAINLCIAGIVLERINLLRDSFSREIYRREKISS
jgi:glycosyltransferase involved in cell wall biosynthesis